jgi:hypothetical protein
MTAALGRPSKAARGGRATHCLLGTKEIFGRSAAGVLLGRHSNGLTPVQLLTEQELTLLLEQLAGAPFC